MKERKLCISCLILFVMGFLAVHLAGEFFLEAARPPLAAACFQENETVFLKGQVWKQEERPEYKVLYVRDNSLSKDGRNVKEPGVILYYSIDASIKTGNVICAKGEIFFFDPARNPGNFDQKFYYQKQNIHAGMWAEQLEVEEDTCWNLRNTLDSCRIMWKRALLEGAGEMYGGILAAMILGERQEMDQEVKELYQVNGIAHILSVSGLHLSFIGAGLYRLFRKCTGSYLAGGIAGISFLILYILMIGLGVSVLRALVMFLIRVGADMSGRVYDMPTALAAAAVAVVIWRPLSYYDGGFQMSFGAVLGIWIVGEITDKTRSRIGNMLQTSVGVQMALLPVTLYHYFAFPVYAVFLNLFVVPLMSVLLFFGMAGSLLYAGGSMAGQILLWICGRILDIYEMTCRAALLLPVSQLVAGRPEGIAIFFYYLSVGIGILLWERTRRRKKRRKSPVLGKIQAVFPVCIGVLVLLLAGYMERKGTAEAVMLDVGQGDCIFVQAPDGTAMLVDGGSSDVDQVGRYRIEPFLKARGTGTLDYVFVTHGDGDHVNGIAEMLERQDKGIKIACLILPPRQMWEEGVIDLAVLAEEYQTRIICMERGKRLSCGSFLVTCLQPDSKDKLQPGNEASLVLEFAYKDFDMLLTGDVEMEGETLLTGRLHKKYDVLKAAHHGSENSTSDSFLDAVSPREVLISAGPDNPYGHPHKTTLRRLERAGCRIWQSAKQGAVIIRTDGRKMRIIPFLG